MSMTMSHNAFLSSTKPSWFPEGIICLVLPNSFCPSLPCCDRMKEITPPGELVLRICSALEALFVLIVLTIQYYYFCSVIECSTYTTIPVSSIAKHIDCPFELNYSYRQKCGIRYGTITNACYASLIRLVGMLSLQQFSWQLLLGRHIFEEILYALELYCIAISIMM